MAKKYTDEQNRAYGAGVGYATAKKGGRVPVKDENKESFRKGLEQVRGKKKATKSEKTREDKIKYYSSRIDDPKLSKGQRDWAVKRLGDLANSGK